MKIAVATDHAGFELKKKIIEYLKKKSHELKDFGCYSEESCDYPDFAKQVASSVSEAICDRGILICGSGVGVSIVANKFPNVRAVLCYSEEIALLSREHNDANILCIGARFVRYEDVVRWIDVFLDTVFLQGRHKNRVDKIKKVEEELCAR